MGVSITGGIKTINDIKAGLYRVNIVPPSPEDVTLIVNGDGAEDDFFSPTVNTTVLESEIVKAGTYSLAFNSSQWIEYPLNSGFDFGTGDFTIEAWVYLNAYASTSVTTLFDFRNARATEDRFIMFMDSTDSKVRTYVGGVFYAESAGTVALSEWMHIAAVKQSGDITVYLNGVGGTAVTQPETILPSKMRIGQPAGSELVINAFNGYMDNIRITKGHAVYQNDFTPPNTL